jgi:glycine cleavage system H protein
MSKILEGIKYSESHEWVKVEGNIAVIGVSDFAQKEMGDITYVDMPEVDDEVEAGEEFGALESVKASSELISPVSGTVVEVNSELEDTPEKVNEDAYGAWIIKVEMSDPSELDNLLDAAGYKALIKE